MDIKLENNKSINKIEFNTFNVINNDIYLSRTIGNRKKMEDNYKKKAIFLFFEDRDELYTDIMQSLKYCTYIKCRPEREEVEFDGTYVILDSHIEESIKQNFYTLVKFYPVANFQVVDI